VLEARKRACTAWTITGYLALGLWYGTGNALSCMLSASQAIVTDWRRLVGVGRRATADVPGTWASAEQASGLSDRSRHEAPIGPWGGGRGEHAARPAPRVGGHL